MVNILATARRVRWILFLAGVAAVSARAGWLLAEWVAAWVFRS